MKHPKHPQPVEPMPAQAVRDALRPERCLECKSLITERSSYTFFCSQGCAAKWGDDEALLQALDLEDAKNAREQ